MIHSRKTYERKNKRMFFSAALGVFGLTFFAFNAVGFVPYYIDGTESRANFEKRAARLSQFGFDTYRSVALGSLPQLGEEENIQAAENSHSSIPVAQPERIVINSISIDLPVLNPESTDIDVLDNALMSGVVRYPLSAELGENGNMLIFGHSSGLPVVHNHMFKAFNALSELEEGDTISVIGGGYKYLYRVDNVYLTDVNDELIDLSTDGGKRLTLSTCNSFGAKSERWVVEAEFVGYFEDGEETLTYSD